MDLRGLMVEASGDWGGESFSSESLFMSDSSEKYHVFRNGGIIKGKLYI